MKIVLGTSFSSIVTVCVCKLFLQRILILKDFSVMYASEAKRKPLESLVVACSVQSRNSNLRGSNACVLRTN